MRNRRTMHTASEFLGVPFTIMGWEQVGGRRLHSYSDLWKQSQDMCLLRTVCTRQPICLPIHTPALLSPLLVLSLQITAQKQHASSLSTFVTILHTQFYHKLLAQPPSKVLSIFDSFDHTHPNHHRLTFACSPPCSLLPSLPHNSCLDKSPKQTSSGLQAIWLTLLCQVVNGYSSREIRLCMLLYMGTLPLGFFSGWHYILSGFQFFSYEFQPWRHGGVRISNKYEIQKL